MSGKQSDIYQNAAPGEAWNAAYSTDRLPVECGNCGWTGMRKPGNLVECPKCGSIAGFQPKE